MKITGRGSFALAIAPLALSGCMVTHPIESESSPVLDPSRALAWGEPKPDHGILLISRDAGIYGSACVTYVYVSGTEVARLKPAEQILIYPPAGDATVGARWGSGLCSGGSAKSITIKLTSGVKSRVRIGLEGNYLRLAPTLTATGYEEAIFSDATTTCA